MAEEAKDAKEAPKKKKKKLLKLPVLMAIVVMFIGGGFYAITKKAAHGPKSIPKIELAEKDTDLEEFLTNTANPAVYVRAKISVRLRKDYDEPKLKENMGDIRDAVILVFNSTQPADITDATKRTELKKRIADAINTAIAATMTKEADKEKPKKDKRGVILPPVKPIVPPDCDSDTGPVMKIRFSALATQ